MAIDKIFDGAVDGIADNLFNSVSNSVSEIKAMQQRKAAENVQLVVQALKKIDADIREKYDGVTETIEKRVANIKDGRDGIDGKNGLDGVNGKDGRDGKDGRNGRDGLTGPRGFDGPKGADGKDGRDGEDGVSVTDAHIDFDGSLIISLSSGRVINVGEVVAADIAEKIKVITNGGGTSQPVLDQLASLQAQIDLISSALVYKGTWNATTNTPTLTSSAGTANTFYIVSVAGTTTLNGISNWGVGDWAVYNGSVWQRIEGGAVGNFTDLSVSGTTTLSGLTASTALALNASKQVVSVTNTGSGSNVLATSPTLVTPVLGIPSSVTLTNATGLPLSTGVTGTLPIANGGTGQTSANAAFNALAPSQTGNSGKYLTTNGSTTSWATVGAGTVTSVAASVPAFLSVSGSPITTSGTLAFSLSGSALPTTSGGTGLTSFTADGVPYATSTSALETSALLKFQTANSALTIASTTTANGYMGFTNSGDGGVQGYIGDSKALMTGGIDNSLTVRGENTLFFAIASTEGMRLNSTGVGIGTSPGSKLDVKGTLRLSGSTSGYVGLAPAAAAGSTTYTLPSADGTANQALVTNGSGTLSWASTATGTVTSVAASVPTFLSISGSPITSSGTLAITLSGTALPTTSGGTGLTSFTANGVAYASSTSALSTGSALTFDGTTLGVTGAINATGGITAKSGATGGSIALVTIGTANNTVGGAGNQLIFNYGSNAASRSYKILNDADAFGDFAIYQSTTQTGSTYRTVYSALNDGTSIWSVGGSEQMRLTSTGLGIGTSSPTDKLTLNSSGSGTGFKITGYQPENFINLNNILSTGNRTFRLLSGITSVGYDGFSVFDTVANATRLVINNSGNLGIGTTSPSYKLDINGDARINNLLWFTPSSGGMALGANGTNFEIYNGAGTETRLTLNNSGNLGLGVTPSAWATYKAYQVGWGSLASYNGSDTAVFSNAYFDGGSWRYIGNGNASQYRQLNSVHSWQIAASGTAGNAITFTQAMTLDASGKLGVGTTSPVARLHVGNGEGLQQAYVYGGGYDLALGASGGAFLGFASQTISAIFNTASVPIGIGTNASQPLIFGTSNTERARIDSSGNFLVGTTSAYGKATISTGASQNGLWVENSSYDYQTLSLWNKATANDNIFAVFLTESSFTGRGSITYNRSAGLVAYNTSSDYRLKENIVDLPNALQTVLQLKPRQFDWKETGNTTTGFIAHELAEVLPHAVTGEKDAVDENGNPKYQGIDTSFLVATLTAAIQEQQAIIESLKARLDAANL